MFSPVAQDIQTLRHALSSAFDWAALEAPLEEIRHHYCDAFRDGQAGKRAAQEIESLINAPQPLMTNTLLHSLQKNYLVELQFNVIKGNVNMTMNNYPAVDHRLCGTGADIT